MERRDPGNGICGIATMDRQKMLSRALWLWVLGVFAAYIIQFKGLAGPILNALMSALGLR